MERKRRQQGGKCGVRERREERRKERKDEGNESGWTGER